MHIINIAKLIGGAYINLKLISGVRKLLTLRKMHLCGTLVLSVFNYGDAAYDLYLNKRQIRLRLIHGYPKKYNSSYKL